ncbi:kinase-like domain-containing protein [Hyaloraphidium curvatum]|nr:kinase-like domain-containing protein [Hyaloraphidium curvatum]
MAALLFVAMLLFAAPALAAERSSSHKPSLDVRLSDLAALRIPANLVDRATIGRDLGPGDLDFGGDAVLGAGGFGTVRKVTVIPLRGKTDRVFAAKGAFSLGGNPQDDYARHLKSFSTDHPDAHEWDNNFWSRFRTYLSAEKHLGKAEMDQLFATAQEDGKGVYAASLFEIEALKALVGGPFILRYWGSYAGPLPRSESLIRGMQRSMLLMTVCSGGDMSKWSKAGTVTPEEQASKKKNNDFLKMLKKIEADKILEENGLYADNGQSELGSRRLVRSRLFRRQDDDDDPAAGEDESPFTDAKAAAMFARVVIGVAYVHQRGFVHNDIKASNVLICSDNLPRIIDFGSTRTVDFMRDGFNGLKAGKPRPNIGQTPGYQAPEFSSATIKKFPNAPLAKYGSDTFALGRMLYDLYHMGDWTGSFMPYRKGDFTPGSWGSGKGPWYEGPYPRFPTLPRARTKAVMDLANKLAAYKLADRPDSPGELLEAVFTSDYILGSGAPEFQVEGATPLAKAQAIIQRLNEQGIEAATTDNQLLPGETFAGVLTAWKKGGAQPVQAAMSLIKDYRCGTKIKVKVALSETYKALCINGGLDPATTRLYFKLSPKSKAKKGRSKLVSILDVPACDFLRDKVNRWSRNNELQGGTGKAAPTDISVTVPAGAVSPGSYFLYGKIKSFESARKVKAAGQEYRSGNAEGYTSEVPVVVVGC